MPPPSDGEAHHSAVTNSRIKPTLSQTLYNMSRLNSDGKAASITIAFTYVKRTKIYSDESVREEERIEQVTTLGFT